MDIKHIPSTDRTEDGRIMMNRHRIFINLIITMFGIATWVGVNGIYVELPLLLTSAPEGWSLPAYIVIVIQAGNLAPIFYAIFRKFIPSICNEPIWISSLLVSGSTAIGLLAFFYDLRTSVYGVDHSVILLTGVFVTSLVGCSSSVLFIPYLRNFDEIYLVSFFVGEGLSGLIPSAIVLLQGVDGKPVCQKKMSNTTNFESPLISGTIFSIKIYFLLLFIVMASCTCAFWVLDYLRVARNQRISSDKNTRDTDSTESKHSVLDKMIFNKSSETHDHARNRHWLYFLMGIISAASHGFLPGMQSYSCLPYGKLAYYLTVSLTNISSPIACVLALWLPPLRLRGVNVISALAVIGTSYVTWLAFSSPIPPLRDTNLGTILVVVTWIILTGLIAYAKLSITAIIRREPGEKSLFYLGMIAQIGIATGAIFSFVLTNYSNFLVPYDPCESPE